MKNILLIFILLFSISLIAQSTKKKAKYIYTTEHTTTNIRCHSLYDRTMYEYAYTSNGWIESNYTYTHYTNAKFSSQDYYDIWVTFEKKDSVLSKN